MAAPARTMTSIATVKRIRCRSSGILKIFVNAEIMEGQTTRKLTANNYRSPGLFDALTRGFAEFVSFNRQFLRELAAPQDLQPVELSVHQPFFAQELLRDMRTIFELLEVAQVHQAVRSLELGVIKSPLWQPSD